MHYLWQAASYTHPVTGARLRGKIHVLRHDDLARTVCGRQITALGGHTFAQHGVEHSSCQGCQNSLAADARRVEAMAQWRIKQEEDDREWWRRYEAYLQTPQWQLRRRRVLERADFRCEGCRQAPATQVHHLTYKRLGHEMLFDLVAVCDACHEAIHRPQGGVCTT